MDAQLDFLPANNKHLKAVARFSEEYLSEIVRRSGESYYQNGLELARTVSEVSADPSLLSVAFLHDILVRPDGEELILKSPLTSEEQALVRQMNNLRNLHININTKDLDHFIKALAEDGRLVLLRIAHRLNDVRHLDRYRMPLQQEIATETIHMYASIAGRLGFNAWRTEMENICFKVLHPDIASRIEEKFMKCRPIDMACLETTRKLILRNLKKNSIEASIECRIKDVYSTYRKMLFKNRPFEELTDRLALRIIVDKVDDCYRALGVVHNTMHPIPGKLKDYIGAPKENGYQSIHTVVYPLPGVTELPIEIQIRTKAIHAECEYGSVAHTKYKDFYYSLTSGPTRVSLLSNLETLKLEHRSPEQFESALRTYFRKDHLVVFDEKDNMYHLKQHATVMDFVCAAYREKCAKIKLVRVNGKVDTLKRTLRNGDVVEVLFTNQNTIKSDWIKACEHRSSRELIKKLLSGSKIQGKALK